MRTRRAHSGTENGGADAESYQRAEQERQAANTAHEWLDGTLRALGQKRYGEALDKLSQDDIDGFIAEHRKLGPEGDTTHLKRSLLRLADGRATGGDAGS